MKVFLDPITTAAVHKCSCHYKFQQIMAHMLSVRDDVFFYYALPDSFPGFESASWEVDESKLLQHPNIKYVRVPAFRDRYKEYVFPTESLQQTLLSCGVCWDIDVVITARTALVPFIRQWINHMQAPRTWDTSVIVIDGFPQMQFKPYAFQLHPQSMAFQTILGYLSADASYVFTPYETKEILIEAKNLLSPAMQLRLKNVLRDAQPIKFDSIKTKEPSVLESVYKKEKPLTIGYVQRIENRRNYVEVFEAMRAKWVLNKKSWPVECVVTTVSERVEGIDMSFISVTKATREQFYSMLDDRIDIILNMSADEGFSLSTMEPLVRGVPIILAREKWSLALVGDKYPFFVSNAAEAYALVKRFHNDYKAQYDIFAAWLRDTFKPEIERRNESSLYLSVEKDIQRHQEAVAMRYKAGGVSITEVAGIFAKNCGEEIHLREEAKALVKQKKLRLDMNSVEVPEAYVKTSLAFTSPLRNYRNDLIHHYGYRDASPEPGHLKK